MKFLKRRRRSVYETGTNVRVTAPGPNPWTSDEWRATPPGKARYEHPVTVRRNAATKTPRT